MKTIIRWGIVGPGNIAEKFASDLINLEDAELTAVASRNLERANRFAETYKPHHVFDSYDALFNCKEVDIVYIATPHVFHKDLAIRAMKAGKHVLCEKPLGVNTAEVEEMIATSKEQEVFLMEALWTRFNPTIKKVKTLIEDGNSW